MYPANKPEVFVTFAKEKIDENGVLKDEKTREVIRQLLQALWIGPAGWGQRKKG